MDAKSAKETEVAKGWLHSWSGKYDWTELSGVKAIPESKMSNAESLLERAVFVPLTDTDVAKLTAEPVTASNAIAKPYLLRAVGATNGRLPLQVFSRANGDVWVGGEAISRCTVPIQRRAVIAWLKQSPQDVYVTFATAR
jgi:hypothetical protein